MRHTPVLTALMLCGCLALNCQSFARAEDAPAPPEEEPVVRSGSRIHLAIYQREIGEPKTLRVRPIRDSYYGNNTSHYRYGNSSYHRSTNDTYYRSGNTHNSYYDATNAMYGGHTLHYSARSSYFGAKAYDYTARYPFAATPTVPPYRYPFAMDYYSYGPSGSQYGYAFGFPYPFGPYYGGVGYGWGIPWWYGGAW